MGVLKNNKKRIIYILIAIIIIGLIVTSIIVINNRISKEHNHSRIVHIFETEVVYELSSYDKNIKFETKEENNNDTTTIWYISNDEYTRSKYGEVLANIGINQKTDKIHI